MTSTAKQGPNVRKLIARRMTMLTIPADVPNPFAHAMSELAKPGNIAALARQATDWVAYAISLVKTAPDNPYGDDDEAIAGAILEKIEADKPTAGRVR